MASNFKALPEKSMRGAPENRDMPLPLLDLSDAAVKELIRSAKKRGYVTLAQINCVLPAKGVSSEQLKSIVSIFAKMGLDVVDIDKAEEESAAQEESEEATEGENSVKR